MKTLMKRLSHQSRWVLFIFSLVVSLSIVIIALSQLRTTPQSQRGTERAPASQQGIMVYPAHKDDVTPAAGKEVADDETQVIAVDPGSLPSGSLPSGTLRSIEILASQGFGGEAEPNNTFGTATPLGGTNVVVRANLFPNGDIDFYSFTAAAGDRVYAATMTSFSAGSTDSQITLLASDGTTIIEFDDDNGTFAGSSSSVAGATISAPGTYYLKINDSTAGITSERPYELHFRIQSGTPTPEVEGNNTPPTANPLPPNGWVSGARDPAAATEQDWFSITLAAGDTVYLALDLDPERDVTTWNGRLGFALFGDAGNLILVVDDAGIADTIDSEAMFFTVKTAGTYFAFVDSASAATGGPTATYHLSVSVHPATNEGVNCTTYTSDDVPKTIGPGTGLVSSTIIVLGNPRIQDLEVSITLNHAVMADIDAHLRSPAGNDNGLFNDIGAGAVGGQTMMDTVFDDEAGIPPAFTAFKGLQIKPQLNYRLAWFDGENAGGTWTLDLRDDNVNANGGTLTSWSLTICEQPPEITCPSGTTTVFSTDFEADDAGFTHSGTADEWERGLPANPPAVTTCNSGVNCWKTDLDNTYNASSSQDLFSPNIDLTTQTGPVVLSWAQRYQIESATNDHAFVEVQEVGGAGATRQVWQWLDATMTNAPGNSVSNIEASAGWGNYHRDISDFAGKIVRVRFHLDSNPIVQLGGLAIDDVKVTACSAEPSPTPTPVIVADGSILVNESCPPANGQIDPGERVTVHLKLKNNGGASTSNLVATLQSGGGVVAPSNPQNYGVISPGSTVGRDFTFTADPAGGPGGTITATLQLQDGATNLGTVSYTFTAGPSPCGGVRLVTSSTLVRTSASNVLATVTVSNIGTLPAANVMLTTAMLGGTSGTLLPQSLGTINPGSSVSTTVNFATMSTGPSTLTIGGTFTGGTFSSTKRVTIPGGGAGPSRF